MRLVAVVGARPNFVKLAALVEAFRPCPGVRLRVVHTGQHYDRVLSNAFFADLQMNPPDVHLGVAPAAPVARLAAMLAALEPVLREERADRVLVVGDVDSTLAGALVASRLGIPLAHVEAGLRSGDPSMPEEVNRRLTDALSDRLFVTEESGLRHLESEGLAGDGVHLVGNVMIDTLLRHRSRADRSDVLARLGLEPGGYGVLTLHRPATVDHGHRLMPLLASLAEGAGELPIVFPVHPRTRDRLPAAGSGDRLRRIDPLGYLDFVKLLSAARVVLTDSGGVQEETTALGIRCLTLRRSTERPATVEQGTNEVVGTDPAPVRQALERALAAPPPDVRRPPLWDGRAGERIARILTA